MKDTENIPSLDTLRDLFKEGEFDQAQEGVKAYLAAHPADADADSSERAKVLALGRHLDNLDTLKQIHRAVLTQDWDQAVHQIEAAIEMGLTWDIELYPLAALLESAKQRRSQMANRKAQSLCRQAEEAEKKRELDRARDLYEQAIAVPHLDPSFQAQLRDRLDALHTDARVILTTVPTMMQPDALMKQLVDTILEKSRPQVAEAVRLCAVPFYFNLGLLSALRDSDDGLDEKILARMARFSFIHQDDRGHYTFSQDVRHYLLSEWDKDREGFVEANRRAQSYFLQELGAEFLGSDVADALVQPGQAALLRVLTGVSPEVGELVQSYLYHTLAVDGDAGIVLLRQLFHAADEAHRLALAERYLEIANEQRAYLDPGQRAHVDFMRGLLDQLQGRWEASRNLFERMLSREGLPTMLQARVRRALGNTLIEQEQWVEAIALFKVALQDFEAGGDALESALTMLSMGRAHLDLALNTWGGGETFRLGRSWSDRMRDLVTLFSRSPITTYLMSRLGVRALLPVILRIGRDMDWPIARLFATAARWFSRADTILRQLDDQEGLGRVEENLAWLYLSIGHFKRAEAIYHRLLAREGVALGEYRAARARLGLAQALMHRGHLTQARELLERIQPIFVAYQHTERTAQTHTALAQTYALEGQPGQAVPHYQQAVQLYQQIGDDTNVTEVVEQMRLLRDQPQTDEAVRQSIEVAASQVTHRHYPTHFSLSLLQMFRLLALIGLISVVLFSLLTSIRIESGTDFGVSEALLSSRQNTASPFEPIIELDLEPQLQPSFEIDFGLYLILIALVVYLVLYTVLGLWLTMRTSLRTLQEGQRFDIVIDPEGVGRGTEDLPGSLKIKWEQVAAILRSDRGLFRKPIAIFSRFALFGEQGAVVVDGQTRRYLSARDFILERLHRPSVQPTRPEGEPTSQSIPTYEFGFSIFCSHSGRLFAGTLVFILAFILTAKIAPEIVITHLGPLPYSLADLYSISYLGLLIPAGWRLALQPLRERLFLKPNTRRVWLVGLVGLLLAVFTFVDSLWLRLPIGRPNVAPGLFAAFLVGLAAYWVLTTQRWEHMPFRRGDYVYSFPVRLASGVVALVVILLALGFVVREVGAYHYLALANYNRQQAAEEAEDARAREPYEKALSFYDQALNWVGDDADVYHSRGAMLAQLDRYAEAVESIQQAISLNPGKMAYVESLAITYEKWAQAHQEAGDEEGARKYYELARDNYNLVLKEYSEDSVAAINLYLLRAGAYSQLGEYHAKKAKQEDTAGNLSLASASRQAAIENYEAAYADYAHVVELVPDNVEALVGLGWMEYKLAKFEGDLEKRRTSLALALAYFEQAAAADPEQLSIWTGQGLAHFAIGETFLWGNGFTPCSRREGNPRTPQEAQIYQEENLQALAAFEQATDLAPDNVGLYNVRGRIRFVLLSCPDMDNEELFLAAIDDYSQTIALEPDNPEWYDVRGHLYYNLGPEYYPQTIADFEDALSLKPDVGLYLTLGNLHFIQGEMDQAVQAYGSAIELAAPEAAKGGFVSLEILDRVVRARPDWSLAYYNRGYQRYWQQRDNEKAAADLRRATELDPNHYGSQLLLGWLVYLSGDYRDSAEISRVAAALDPTEPLAYFNRGVALVALGDAEEAWRAYEEGIAAANALTAEGVAISRYSEAIGDLEAVAQDPAGIGDALRARLSFKKALIYIKLGREDQAQSTYGDGIVVADTLTDEETRRSLYDEAIADLQALDTDPTSIVAELVTQLELARDR